MKNLKQIFEDYKIAMSEDYENQIDLKQVIFDILKCLTEDDFNEKGTDFETMKHGISMAISDNVSEMNNNLTEDDLLKRIMEIIKLNI